MDSLCEELTNDLLTICAAGKYFCDDSRKAAQGSFPIAELNNEKEYLDEPLKEYIKNKFSVEGYLERIKLADNWRFFGELMQHEEVKQNIEKDLVNFYTLVKMVFARYPIVLRDDEALYGFYELLDNREIEATIGLAFADKPEKEREKWIKYAIGALKTALIHRVFDLKGRVEIQGNRYSNTKSDFIGFYLTKGQIKIYHAGDKCGCHMKGGLIKADHIGHQAGFMMTGGEIHTEQIGQWAGMMATGGRIYVESAQGKFGSLSSGGVYFADWAGQESAENAEGSVFVLGKISTLPMIMQHGVLIANEAYPHQIQVVNSTFLVNTINYYQSAEKPEISGNIYGYSDETGRYFEHVNNAPILIADSDETLAAWKKEKQGLCLVDNLNNITGDPTADLEDGILVLRALPEGKIGEQMKGGVVILEVPGLTLDEAAERVAMDRNITGAILMRVPDGREKGKSKLVEVVNK